MVDRTFGMDLRKHLKYYVLDKENCWYYPMSKYQQYSDELRGS